MKYEFTDDYLTGIPSIDEEHGRLFELTNECYELVMDDAAVDRFDRIVALLEELRTYAATHFAHEEEYMERIQYERRFSERYQHLRFIQKLSEIDLDAIDENQQEYLLKILDFLARWLCGHIKIMDCRIPREEDIAAQRAAQAATAAAEESTAATAAQEKPAAETVTSETVPAEAPQSSAEAETAEQEDAEKAPAAKEKKPAAKAKKTKKK